MEFLEDLIIRTDENIMVIDNTCDQSIININAFYVTSFAGVLYNVGGALQGMSSSSLELVNEAYTLTILPNNDKVIFMLNQCFLDRYPLQTEALLQPHQARAHDVIVDNWATCHVGSTGNPGGTMPYCYRYYISNAF